MSYTLFEYSTDESQIIQTVTIELIQNLILEDKVLQEFIVRDECKQLVIHVREILKLFIKNAQKFSQ